MKKSSEKSFGVVFFIVFFLIGFWPILNNQEIKIWSIILSFIFLILGLFNSPILKPLNIIWYKIGIFLGMFIAPIFIGVVYFLVVTPTGLIMRLFGKDLINLKKNNDKTYWIIRKSNKIVMKNQF
tara:strand:+ start:116 stop:490 length:375 start_codon:yes stop_codon:yes gene_type:complete